MRPQVLLSLILFSPKLNPGLALPWLQQCCRGKWRRGWLRLSSSHWCRRGGRWRPRTNPTGNRSQTVPRSPAAVAPEARHRGPLRSPMEVRGVRGGAGRMMMVLRMLQTYLAIGCVCRWGECGFWGGYSPNPCTPSRVDPAAGKGCVCSPLLISAICPLQPRRRLLLGQVGERWCKAVGVLFPQGFIGCYCPPKPTLFGFLPQKPTQRPPPPSSSSRKRPSPCPPRRWVRRCSNWTSRNPAPSR